MYARRTGKGHCEKGTGDVNNKEGVLVTKKLVASVEA